MRAIGTLAAAAALLALTACDRLGIGGGDAAKASANAAANASDAGKEAAGNAAGAASGSKDTTGATPAAAAGGAVTLDRAYVAGRWTDNGDCSVAVDFGMDGRFTANNGAGGLWNLDGDRLTMSGSTTLTLQIVPIDQNTMNVVNPDGSLGRSTRC